MTLPEESIETSKLIRLEFTLLGTTSTKELLVDESLFFHLPKVLIERPCFLQYAPCERLLVFHFDKCSFQKDKSLLRRSIQYYRRDLAKSQEALY